MSDVPTIPPLITPDDFARRLRDLVPAGWGSTTAIQPGGVLYSLLRTVGGELSFELGTPNSLTITVSGTVTPGDAVVLQVTVNLLPATVTFVYRTQAGDTIDDVAAALGYQIGSDPDLTAIGVEANVFGPVLSLIWPTIPVNAVWSTAPPELILSVRAQAFTSVINWDDPNVTWSDPNFFWDTAPGGATEVVTVELIPTPLTGSLQYAAAAMRIQTAVGKALDDASKDFLGDDLPRYSGEADAPYRVRVLAALLPSGATRAVISAAVERVTGVVPRMIEPWRPSDTGVLDGVVTSNLTWDAANVFLDTPGFVWDSGEKSIGAIYLDVDSAVWPGRLTDPGLRYQGFIETTLPTIPLLGGNPLPCLDDGIYLDAAGSSAFDFEGSVPLGAQLVYDAINRVKVDGTVAWVRFGSSVPAPVIHRWPGAAAFAGSGTFSIIVGKGTRWVAAAGFVGTGTLLPATRGAGQIATSFIGSGSFTIAVHNPKLLVGAGFAGTGTLGSEVRNPRVVVSAGFAAIGQFVVSTNRASQALAAFSGAGSFAGGAGPVLQTTAAAFVAAGTFAGVIGGIQALGAASFAGSGSFGPITFVQTGALTADDNVSILTADDGVTPLTPP